MVAISNSPGGEVAIQAALGERVLYIPYVMPGFALARRVYELTRDVDWSKYEGLVLQHHGIFSFADSGRESYERMIRLVSLAEDFLKSKGALVSAPTASQPAPEPELDLRTLAALRKEVSLKAGAPVVARLNSSAQAQAYAGMPRAAEISEEDHEIEV